MNEGLFTAYQSLPAWKRLLAPGKPSALPLGF